MNPALGDTLSIRIYRANFAGGMCAIHEPTVKKLGKIFPAISSQICRPCFCHVIILCYIIEFREITVRPARNLNLEMFVVNVNILSDIGDIM